MQNNMITTSNETGIRQLSDQELSQVSGGHCTSSEGGSFTLELGAIFARLGMQGNGELSIEFVSQTNAISETLALAATQGWSAADTALLIEAVGEACDDNAVPATDSSEDDGGDDDDEGDSYSDAGDIDEDEGWDEDDAPEGTVTVGPDTDSDEDEGWDEDDWGDEDDGGLIDE